MKAQLAKRLERIENWRTKHLTVVEAEQLFHTIKMAIRKNVTDKDTLAAIRKDLEVALREAGLREADR